MGSVLNQKIEHCCICKILSNKIDKRCQLKHCACFFTKAWKKTKITRGEQLSQVNP